MRRDSDAIVVPCGAHETNKLPWMDVEICVRDLCAPRLKRRVPSRYCARFETPVRLPARVRPRPCVSIRDSRDHAES
jgi:hypothetical protein